jgi:membrane protein implicated in regulation of membrane protease activity
MYNTSHTGRAVTVVGASLFLVAAAALSLSLYGGRPSTAKTVVLMVFAILSALVLFIGQYLSSAEGNKEESNTGTSEAALRGLSPETKHGARH